MRLAQLEAVVESLLFISGEAVPLTAIAQTIEMDKATARAIVQSLADKYEAEQRGIRIVEINGSYQMCTAAECFTYIRSMYKSPQRQGLTQSLLETLAIIAYKQPITRLRKFAALVRNMRSASWWKKSWSARWGDWMRRANPSSLAPQRTSCGILALSLYQNCRRWKMTPGWQSRKKQKNKRKFKKRTDREESVGFLIVKAGSIC